MNNSGCGILGLIAAIWVLGNLALFTLGLEELFDSGIGTLIFLFTIMGDLFVLLYIMVCVIGHFDKKKEEKEKQQTALTNEKIENILSTYKPEKLMSFKKGIYFNTKEKFLNKEVITAVNTLKIELKDTIQRCELIDSRINEFLNSDKDLTADEKLKNLIESEEELKELKSESDTLHNEICGKRINLLNENKDRIMYVRNICRALQSSKKFVSESTTFNDLVCGEIPQELSMFIFKYDPVTINISNFYFCFFSNVILVFDKEGLFSSALDPTAFKIRVEKQEDKLKFIDDEVQEHQYIDEDSKCIMQGEENSFWLYSRVDGGPDLRYNYNPLTKYRTDIYEYYKINIAIADYSISIYLSSENSANNIEQSIKRYRRRYNNKQDPIPELLGLLLNISDNNDMQEVLEQYKTKSTNRNYFVELKNI